MRYIKLKNDQPIDYTIEELMIAYPNAGIYKLSKLPDPELLSQYNVYPLITEQKPTVNEDEAAEESVPEFRDGEWHQTWTVRKLTIQEIDEIVKTRTSTPIQEEMVIQQGYFTTKETADQRYEVCKTCDALSILKTCKECGCIMPLKVRIAHVTCPLGKW
jgi:hypothetical protein